MAGESQERKEKKERKERKKSGGEKVRKREKRRRGWREKRFIEQRDYERHPLGVGAGDIAAEKRTMRDIGSPFIPRNCGIHLHGREACHRLKKGFAEEEGRSENQQFRKRD